MKHSCEHVNFAFVRLRNTNILAKIYDGNICLLNNKALALLARRSRCQKREQQGVKKVTLRGCEVLPSLWLP